LERSADYLEDTALVAECEKASERVKEFFAVMRKKFQTILLAGLRKRKKTD
jgi:hypothetical protein